MAEPVLRVDALTKRYGAARGVEDVTFDVHEGEVFGFLGPNGAGKTTTIRLVMDLLRPTSGRALVFGLDAHEDRLSIHRRVGYLPGEFGIPQRIVVRDHLRHHALLRRDVDWAVVERLAGRLGLDLARPVKALSRGNRQKVGLVQAMMSEPELLVLDEPTTGLDPLVQREFNALVNEAKAAGRTVFLSSHILPEVEHLCDRIAIIREGRIVAVDDVPTLKRRATRRLVVRFARDANTAWLDGVDGVASAHARGPRLEFALRGEAGPALEALAPHGVVDVETHEPTLEDVFLSYYGGETA